MHKCPVCKRVIEPSSDQFTYAIVEGRSFRLSNKPEGLSAPARIDHVHEICALLFQEHVTQGRIS